MYGKSRFSSRPALAAHNLSLSDGIRFLWEGQNVVKSIVLDKRDKNFTTKQIKHKFRFSLMVKKPYLYNIQFKSGYTQWLKVLSLKSLEPLNLSCLMQLNTLGKL